MIGTVFDIQHFSMDDGDGIRTVVFLKGCPLKCIWCHNPEGLKKEKQLFFSSTLCTDCGKCTKSNCDCHKILYGKHLLERKNCIDCGECVKYCRSNALRIVGKEMSVQEVLFEVCKDKAYYKDDGGITLSGGEPMYQADFAIELLKASKQAGLNTCMETCGMCSSQDILKAAEYTDMFYFDIKHTDSQTHKALTGSDNTLILKNLELLSEAGKNIVLRVPVIPNKNDSQENMINIALLCEKLKGVNKIHLLPYHTIGIDKYSSVGLLTEFAEKTGDIKERCKYLASIMQNKTSKPIKVIV